MKATNFAPNWPVGTRGSSSAQVMVPQHSQVSRRGHGRILRRQPFDLSLQFVNLSLHTGLHFCHLHCTSSDSTNAFTAGVISANSSGGMSDIRVMHVMSRILSFLYRPIPGRERLRHRSDAAGDRISTRLIEPISTNSYCRKASG